MKKISICLVFLLLLLTQCSLDNSNTTNKTEDKNDANQVTDPNCASNNEKKTSSSNDKVKDKVNLQNNIAEKIKTYINNGQENKPEAQKLKWSQAFLNQLDIENLYKQYIDSGKGKADDLEGFAKYMTLNAPISANWKELFEKDLYDKYGEKVVRLEPLNNDSYQAYISKNGSEVPYVVVSSRTGYFHG